MMYLVWIISWFFCQRVMMLLGLVAYNTCRQTLGLTMIAFIACYLSSNNLLVLIYIIWIIRWVIRCFNTGGIIAGIAVLFFHIWIYLICVDKAN